MSEDIKNTNESVVGNANNDSFKTEAQRVVATDDFNYLLGDKGFEFQKEDESQINTNAIKPTRKSKEKTSRNCKRSAKGLKTIIWIIAIFAISVLLAFTIILVVSLQCIIRIFI